LSREPRKAKPMPAMAIAAASRSFAGNAARHAVMRARIARFCARISSLPPTADA